MFIALLIVSVLAAFAVGKIAWDFFFAKDEEKEDRKRAAAKIASTLSSHGFKRLPVIFEAYAFNDWSQMAVEIKKLADLILDGEEAILKEFNEVYTRVLDAKLATPEGLAYLEARIAEVKAPPVAEEAPVASK